MYICIYIYVYIVLFRASLSIKGSRIEEIEEQGFYIRLIFVLIILSSFKLLILHIIIFHIAQ